ncbi:DUF6507 family protein [Streptomyces sp. 4N509B]|uniref:DUF6507 family protein n=1 Tax=Streptomyces sp. 4N509B TaxID=3457413 RepID=UPI003FD1CA08
MPDWDINPTGVEEVIGRTVDRADDVEGWGSGYGTHLQNAATYAGTLAMAGQEVPAMGIVGAALGEFAEATRRDIEYVVVRASNSLAAAREATIHYVNGDLDMAADSQREAQRPPELPSLQAPGPRQGAHQEPV